MQIDYETAKQWVEVEIAKAGGDYVYPHRRGCVYVMDGKPSCIVGHVLMNNGVTDAEFFYYRNNSSFSSIEGSLHRKGVLFSIEAVDYLQHLQDYQDAGRPWGEAHLLAMSQVDAVL